MLHEVLLRLAHWTALVTHQHRVHVAHTVQRGVLTAVTTNHIPTPSTMMLSVGEEKSDGPEKQSGSTTINGMSPH